MNRTWRGQILDGFSASVSGNNIPGGDDDFDF